MLAMNLFAIELVGHAMESPVQRAGTFAPVLLRWIHFLAGFTWIGLLYYFNIVQTPFMKETDPVTKSGVIMKLLPRALWWFRWSALLTVVAGFSLLIVGRVLNTAILLGGLLGLVMLVNVWMVIWPHQQEVIRLTAAAEATKSAPPPELALHARVAYLASRTNFYLSFPTLLLMGMSAHFPQF